MILLRPRDGTRKKKLIVVAFIIVLCLYTFGSKAINGLPRKPQPKKTPPTQNSIKQHLVDEHLEPCTVKNPLTNQFFDLRPLAAKKKTASDKISIQPQPWISKGYDYGGNFTLGICSSPLSQDESMENDFVTVNKNNKTDVGVVFAEPSENTPRVALGLVSTQPKFRGKKLVMEYKGGDICPGPGNRRKSSLLLFTCDRSIPGRAKVSYVGSSDDCSYVFEVRTIHACGAAPNNESVGILSIILIIGAAAAITFFGGGLLYKLFMHLGLDQQRRVAKI